jgi:hypothetical protein
MVQKPEFNTEVKAEVKGYACFDDCYVYCPKVSQEVDGCGYNYTPKSFPFW